MNGTTTRAVYVFDPQDPKPAPGLVMLTETRLLPGGAALSISDAAGETRTALLAYEDLSALVVAAETILQEKEHEEDE